MREDERDFELYDEFRHDELEDDSEDDFEGLEFDSPSDKEDEFSEDEEDLYDDPDY